MATKANLATKVEELNDKLPLTNGENYTTHLRLVDEPLPRQDNRGTRPVFRPIVEELVDAGVTGHVEIRRYNTPQGAARASYSCRQSKEKWPARLRKVDFTWGHDRDTNETVLYVRL